MTNAPTSKIAQDYPELQFPLIHLNGSSGKTLGNEYFEAFKALLDFEETFYEVSFHQRDYYPLGDEAWNQAISNRDEIKKKIAEIRKYLEVHSQHCFECAR